MYSVAVAIKRTGGKVQFKLLLRGQRCFRWSVDSLFGDSPMETILFRVTLLKVTLLKVTLLGGKRAGEKGS